MDAEPLGKIQVEELPNLTLTAGSQISKGEAADAVCDV